MATVDRDEKIRFVDASRRTLSDSQMRSNIDYATDIIRNKRQQVVDEISDWQTLREQGEYVKNKALAQLPGLLEQLELRVVQAGGHVHWARTADEANKIIIALAKEQKAREVVKVKSMTTEEIQLNQALAQEGIQAIETDLAELIIQLGDDVSSHIIVPSVHWNKEQIRDLFVEQFGLPTLSSTPTDLTAAARQYLRDKFLTTDFAVSGANFAVAETGTVGIVESEGNGRMCLTLPKTLVSVMGIEKVIPTWQELSPFLELLPRSATGERMNPYTSMWTGVHDNDGPQAFHLVLLDNGRSDILADPIARQTLHCIRCGSCLNVCPVYRRAGGQAYQSPYSGPIGALLSPQLWHNEKHFGDLPFASSLCGACKDVCPVKINIPRVLTHLRNRLNGTATNRKSMPVLSWFCMERMAIAFMTWVSMSDKRFRVALKCVRFFQQFFVKQRSLSKDNYLRRFPFMSPWFRSRDLKPFEKQSFREWWSEEQNKN